MATPKASTPGSTTVTRGEQRVSPCPAGTAVWAAPRWPLHPLHPLHPIPTTPVRSTVTQLPHSSPPHCPPRSCRADFTCNLAQEHIHFGTVHVYPDSWGMGGPQGEWRWLGEEYLADRKRVADRLGELGPVSCIAGVVGSLSSPQGELMWTAVQALARAPMEEQLPVL
jgi:hypothetical protein